MSKGMVESEGALDSRDISQIRPYSRVGTVFSINGEYWRVINKYSSPDHGFKELVLSAEDTNTREGSIIFFVGPDGILPSPLDSGQ